MLQAFIQFIGNLFSVVGAFLSEPDTLRFLGFLFCSTALSLFLYWLVNTSLCDRIIARIVKRSHRS